MAEAMPQATAEAVAPSGRYVTVGRGTAAYRAFVPAALPPALAYDAELVRALSAADRALGELAGFARRGFQFPIADWFANREAVLSARIEGLDVDLLDLHAGLAGLFPLPDLRPRPPLDVLQEVVNGSRAMVAGRSQLHSLPLSLRLIRDVHRAMFAGIREEQTSPGEFRRSQNWIGPAGALLNEATYVPPPPAELLPALDSFEKYLHQDDGNPPLIRLALIHQHFEAIHPFLDGNGRVGRLLILLLLKAWDLLPDELLTMSAYFLRHRQEYFRLCLAVSEEGGWRDWVRFFLRGVAEEARDALDRAQQLMALHKHWYDSAHLPRRNQSRASCVDAFFYHPVQSYRSLQGWRRHADHLVAEGFLDRLTDQARGDIVVAREIFRIMDE
jgi:Fic family protein